MATSIGFTVLILILVIGFASEPYAKQLRDIELELKRMNEFLKRQEIRDTRKGGE